MNDCKFALEDWKANLVAYEHRERQVKVDNTKLSILFTMVNSSLSPELRSRYEDSEGGAASTAYYGRLTGT